MGLLPAAQRGREVSRVIKETYIKRVKGALPPLKNLIFQPYLEILTALAD